MSSFGTYMSCDKQLSNAPEYNQIVRHYLWTDLQLNTGIVTCLICVYYFRTPDFTLHQVGYGLQLFDVLSVFNRWNFDSGRPASHFDTFFVALLTVFQVETKYFFRLFLNLSFITQIYRSFSSCNCRRRAIYFRYPSPCFFKLNVILFILFS